MHSTCRISGEEGNRVSDRPSTQNCGTCGATHNNKLCTTLLLVANTRGQRQGLLQFMCNLPSNQWPQGLLHSLPIPTTPWSSIGMDFVGPFPLSNEVDYIWVVLCQLTSLVHLIPLWTMTTAAQLAPIFMNHVVRLHGLPETIVSNRDSKFTLRFWTETHCLLSIKLVRSTAFHPQSNGASERMIRKVSQILRTVVRPDQLDWPKQLPMVEFAINSSVSESTGFAPFELMYGYLPRTIQTVRSSEFAGVQEFANNAKELVLQAHDTLIASRVCQMHNVNNQR